MNKKRDTLLERRGNEIFRKVSGLKTEWALALLTGALAMLFHREGVKAGSEACVEYESALSHLLLDMLCDMERINSTERVGAVEAEELLSSNWRYRRMAALLADLADPDEALCLFTAGIARVLHARGVRSNGRNIRDCERAFGDRLRTMIESMDSTIH